MATFDFTHFSLMLTQLLPQKYNGTTFSANTTVAQESASIELPPSLFDTLNTRSSTRIKHAVYRNKDLFLRRTEDFYVPASSIISASVVGQMVNNLEHPIMLNFGVVRATCIIIINYFYC